MNSYPSEALLDLHDTYTPDNITMRVALVIGGGGLGRAVAARLLQGQCGITHVVQTSRHTVLQETHAEGFCAKYMDPLSEDSIIDTLAQLEQEDHPAASAGLSLVVNCTGILHAKAETWPGAKDMGPEKTIQAVNPEWMIHNYRVNCVGPTLVAKHAAPWLVKAAGGRRGKAQQQVPAVLANISARVGSVSDNNLGGWLSYRASKAGLNQATRTVSLELKQQNVVCCTLHPGTVETALSAPWQGGVKTLFTPEYSAEEMLKVVEGLKLTDAGSFFAYDGSQIPY